MNEARRIQGFTLIEVMVAILILSVGLLALAGMQMTGLRSVNDASTYTQATLAINDIIERIRANSSALYLVTDSSNAAQIDCTAMPNPYCSAYYDSSNQAYVQAEACTPGELATFDLNVWFCGENTGNGRTEGVGVRNIFPQAAFTIDNSGAACTLGNPCTIAMSWQELNPDRSDVNGDGIRDETIQRNVTLTMTP